MRKKLIPPDLPEVHRRTVTFFLTHGVKVDTDTTVPMGVLEWHLTHSATFTIIPTDRGKTICVRMSDVISIMSESEHIGI